jgi:hypothetical protein
MAHGASVVFIAQLVVLLVGGRLMGELMQRLGQPSVIGQIIAGVLLGPSVLGALAPHHRYGDQPVGFPGCAPPRGAGNGLESACGGAAVSRGTRCRDAATRADIAAVHLRRAAHAPGRVGLAASKNILTSVRRR